MSIAPWSAEAIPSSALVPYGGELNYLPKVIDTPTKPVCGTLGGVKVANMIQLVMNLINDVNIMVVGDGMAFTFIKEAMR